jgi:CHAT domain-containing protein
LPLAAELPPRNSWNFIPTGMLAMLPIHAAGSAKSGWIDDRVRISVTPSVLESSSPAAADAASDGLVAVSGDSGLPFLAADTVAAKFYHPTFTVLDDARRDDALQAMESASVVVLGGHSREIAHNGAALWLSDGPLTAAHLARLSSRRRELALVCSCSGGRIASTLVDESIGLPHMLLRAGFTTVCASLWPVRDLVSFLFTCHLLGNSARAPATAYSTHVRASRRWLREVTGEQMSAFVAELTTALDLPFVARTVLHRWSQRLAPQQRVFPEPADWAAFAVYSMR